MGSHSFQILRSRTERRARTEEHPETDPSTRVCQAPLTLAGKVAVFMVNRAGATGYAHGTIIHLTADTQSDWLGTTDPTARR